MRQNSVLLPLCFAAGGALSMPHVRRLGTAWERKREDYAYTRELGLTGWAWEFLRLNNEYKRDFRLNRAGRPVVIHHVSGAALYRSQRRFLAAENWGLCLFADPDRSAAEADLFWLPHLLTHSAKCYCTPINDNRSEPLSLSSFPCRRGVLSGIAGEQIAIQGHQKSASLTVCKGTFILGNCSVSFQHDGLNSASRHHETMQILKRLNAPLTNFRPQIQTANSRLLDYLIALDARLQGCSYREIAEVLYGKDRIADCWKSDSFGFKSKVRRCVDRGFDLMNGGYRKLL